MHKNEYIKLLKCTELCLEAVFWFKSVDKCTSWKYDKDTIWNGFHKNFSNKFIRIGCLRIWNGFYNISFRAVEINIKGGLRNEKNH